MGGDFSLINSLLHNHSRAIRPAQLFAEDKRTHSDNLALFGILSTLELLCFSDNFLEALADFGAELGAAGAGPHRVFDLSRSLFSRLS